MLPWVSMSTVITIIGHFVCKIEVFLLKLLLNRVVMVILYGDPSRNIVQYIDPFLRGGM